MKQFSHSSISCFRNCPRQYFYKYVARVKLSDVPGQIALFFGSRCHEALEWLYGRVMNGVVPERGELLAEFGRLWDAEWQDDIVIVEADMTGARYRALGEECVGAYYDAHHPFDESRTVALEQRVTLDLAADDGISMVGYVDRISKTPDGVWHIHDYKTNKGLPTQPDMDANPQLAYYEIGIRGMWPTIERVELHWHFLRFGETITSIRSPEQLEEVKCDALSTVRDAIDRGRDEDAFEPVETGLCNYCDYQSICPVKKHEVRVSGLPPNRYRKEPGVKLVNRWAELKEAKSELNEQIDEIDEEIAEVQEALEEYAEREGVEVVVGDDSEATIRHDEKVMFPRKSAEPDEYAALEQRLAKSPFWPLVSSVDANRLRALWKEPESLDPKLQELLAKFAWADEQVKLGLRKRKNG